MQKQQPHRHCVAYGCAYGDDAEGTIGEDLAYGAVLHTHRFQNADHSGALQNQNQQRRNHIEYRHNEHNDDDDRRIHIVRFEPSEDYRELLLGTSGVEAILAFILVHKSQIYDVGTLACEVCIGNSAGVARDLRRLPAVQLLHIADVGECQLCPRFAQCRAVDATHLKYLSARGVAIQKEEFDTTICRCSNLLGDSLGEDNLFATHLLHTGHCSALQSLGDKVDIRLCINAFQRNATCTFLTSHHHTAQRISLRVGDISGRNKNISQRLVVADRVQFGLAVGVGACDCDICHRTRNKGRNLLLKTENHRQTHHHNGNAYRYGSRSDMHHRILRASAILGDISGYGIQI